MHRYRVTIKEMVCEYIIETDAATAQQAVQQAEARSNNRARLYWPNDRGEVEYEVELLGQDGSL